jgi:hypothetical protein
VTEQEYNARKARIRSLIFTGIAAFLGAYVFRSAPGGVPSATPLIFLAAGVLCLVVAGVTAKKLGDERASK